jgi:hypothetical protein
MELLPPRIPDLALLHLMGDILSPAAADTPALRQKLYTRPAIWPALTDFAAAQGLLPPFIWSLQTRALLPPTPASLTPEQRETFLTTRLAAIFAEHTARTENLAAQLAAITHAFNQAGVPFVTLKGALYLLSLPGSWGTARPMRDIDLLIHPEHATAAVHALNLLGYTADATLDVENHHLPEMRRPNAHGVIELHTEALAPAGRAILPTATVWQVAEPHISPSGDLLLRLPAPWQALHAMLHHQASDDGYAQRTLALKHLWEFAHLCATATPPELPRSQDMLSSWLLQAHQIYALPLPDNFTPSPAAQAQVAACLREAQQPEPSRRARFLARQLRRGFSREMLSYRYRTQQVGLALRARHLLFLLKRYRRTLWRRLFGGTI